MTIAGDFVEKLTSQGYTPAVLSAGDAHLVVLPFGARILGAFPEMSSENTLWVNPAVFDRQKFTAKPGWKNIGGERTWVSPERELFIQNLQRINDSYVVPACFDPGNYRVSQSDSQKIILENDAEVVSYLTGEKATIKILKEIEILPSDQPGTLSYRQTVTLKLLSTTQKMKLGLWNVPQLPAGGKMVIGTREKSSFTPYFGQDSQQRVTANGKNITFNVTATESHKIGVKVDHLTGKIGYIRQLGSELWSLFLRTIALDPAGQYIDTPWNQPEDTGYAVQCYNDNGDFGNFGELEYHSPAIGADTGGNEYRDISRIHIFTGTKSQILDLGRPHFAPDLSI